MSLRLMNISGTFNVLRLFYSPSLCLPHHTVSTFDQLPIPLSKAFPPTNSEKQPDIRAVVLDKDNCFAVPRQNHVSPQNESTLEQLKQAYPGSRLLIVSNSAGTTSDPGYEEAALLERNTGVKVLRHTTKKPGCHSEIMDYFRSAPDSGVTSPSQVAVVGDRLFTDVLMANMMGAHGVWVKEGVVPDHGIASALATRLRSAIMLTCAQLSRFEKGLEAFLTRGGHVAPDPKSDFE